MKKQFWLDDIWHTMDKFNELFEYVCNMGFQENSKNRWWNDEIGVEIDANHAMTFITCYIEENPNNIISIHCANDALIISFKCEGCDNVIAGNIIDDVHAYVFEMLIWIMAKGLGYEEELK
jgi:hypothetical protein|tara:strand:- start:2352 stop:2714 length:363 start_codon:yes stop_codon:yes gene_type:complete